MQIYLNTVIPCCQMSGDDQIGTGSGGDRCTESVVSMVDCTYRLGPTAKTIDTGADPQLVARQVMFDLTKMLNNGSTVSHLEDLGVWFPQWLTSNGYDKIIGLNNVHNPSWNDIVTFIRRGHMAIIGVNDYTQLHLYAGNADPYQWPENAANAGGHVLMLVGYDPDLQTVIVDDPLRGYLGQPANYTWASLQAAGFSDLTEVVGPALPITGLPADSTAECVDVSSWQGNIDWPTYHTWAQKNSADGRSHVIMRASQDVKTKDADFEQNWAGATAAGVDEIVVYHYCYPQYDDPVAEAQWFNSVVGSRLRPQDSYMIDYEENVSQATDAWLLSFAQELTRLTGRIPMPYMNLNMIQTRMSNPTLGVYPLVLADWTFDPNARPACPAPFTSMAFIQYSDKGNVPGIAGNVDLDVFIRHQGASMYNNLGNGTVQCDNGLNTHGWIAGHLLAIAPNVGDWPGLFGQVLENDHDDSDGYWRQTFEKKIAKQSDTNQNDFSLSDNTSAQDAKIAQDQKDLAAKDGQIASLGKQIDGLNSTLSGLVSDKAGLENQLAAEKSQVTSLEDQLVKLQQQLNSKNGSDHDDVKKELQDIVDQLHFLPEVQKFIVSVIEKL